MELNLEDNHAEDEPIMAGGKEAPAENWRLKERNVCVEGLREPEASIWTLHQMCFAFE